MPVLSEVIKIHRRYYRSVNLERDLSVADSVLGYVPTDKSLDALERVANAYLNPRSIRSWTLTGVYGTGKSAFAHFLAALCSSSNEKIRKNALLMLKNSGNRGEKIANAIQKKLPDCGLVRAVVTAQREPVINTILRGLEQGGAEYWSRAKGAKPKAYKDLYTLLSKIEKGILISNIEVLTVVKGLAEGSKSGLLIVIDELGKNLEYSAHNQSVNDLYILQQIAELPSGDDAPQILVLGLLHQSFSDYAHGLTTTQRNEWAKIQGRFEDLPLVDTPEQTIKLIASSIDQTAIDVSCSKAIKKSSERWVDIFQNSGVINHTNSKTLKSVYPLHPVSAMTLPILCNRYAQNDRTLFSFLTSSEPSSFKSFLSCSVMSEDKLPTLKVHQIYDYFVECAGLSTSFRPQFQRWLEIHDRIYDARHLEHDELCALKTIGILNLISSSGSLKASKKLVAYALSGNPDNNEDLSYWFKLTDSLIAKGFVTWRKQIDELRLWEGTDFDIEKEVAKNLHISKGSLAHILNEHFHLCPLIIPRHSYQTGTLRSFERLFVDEGISEADVLENKNNTDGLICYYMGDKRDLASIASTTIDGKPIVYIVSTNQKALKLASHEHAAFKYIYKNSQELKTDGVARREVSERLAYSKKLLERAYDNAFNLPSCDVIIAGLKRKVANKASFNSILSDLCDEFYCKGPKLWNELINRRELTAQGAKARRILCEAMLKNSGQEMLGLTGYGPEVSIFKSLLLEPGIYAFENSEWSFTTPKRTSGVYSVWKAIESFCKSSAETSRSVGELYQSLCRPPYGLRTEIIPLLLLSVLLRHIDEMSLYIDGTFIPAVGPEHLELLVKNPNRFAVKYFEIKGVRAKVFEELEDIFQKSALQGNTFKQNVTLLSVVHPLIKFIKSLPKYAMETKELSDTAIKVRNTLLRATEPDHLIFLSLPEALGLQPLGVTEKDDHAKAKEFRRRLVKALNELQNAYESLMAHCKGLLYDAFNIRSDKARLREDLMVRANYVVGQCIEPTLRRFILAATSDMSNEQDWLEPLLMIVADKPAESWRDEDLLIFETKLSEIARRFINIEALQKGMAKCPGEGFTALRITITKPDGDELNRLVWIDNDKKEKLNKLADKILADEGLSESKELQLSLVATLAAKATAKDSNNKKPMMQLHDKEKKLG